MGARAGLVLAGAASLCACGAAERALGPAPIDPSSPIAGQVRSAERAHAPIPSFRDVPPVPTNVRADSTIQTEKAGIFVQRGRLQATADALPPIAGDTESWAAATRAMIPASERTAPPPDAAAGTQDLAERLRNAATPPPAK